MMFFSDNGPQFDNYEIREFAKEWGFNHDTSSPHWPRSNGMVERHVQTIKNIFKKMENDDRDPYLALLEYRNTPIDNDIYSPNELMFNRKVKGIVPVRNVNKGRINYDDVRNKLTVRQRYQKEYYDRNSHELRPLDVKEQVYARRHMNKPLEKGVIVSKCKRPRSYRIRFKDGRELERNRHHIYPSNARFYNKNVNPFGSKYMYDDNNNYDVINNDNDGGNYMNDNNDADAQVNNNMNAVPNMNNEYVTRSGRESKRPAYLNDYVP